MLIPTPDNPSVTARLSLDIADDDAFSGAVANLVLSRLVPTDPRLKLEGTIGFTYHSECARCLKPVERKMATKFVTLIDLAAGTTEAADLEAEPEPGGFRLIGETEIDLSEELRQRLCLAEPDVVYCASDCKGLCPKCGVDLNVKKCRCGAPGKGGPFDVLKNLKLGD